MNTTRDSFLQLGTRQRNWLRLEHWRRVCAVVVALRRAVLCGLERDAGLSRRQRGLARSMHAQLSRNAAVTKHTTRCRVSGRAHQAMRDVQLARMQLRQQMAEGRLLGFRLGRT